MKKRFKTNDTFWLILLGTLAFGGAKGRFLMGFSLFDFLLIFLFIKSLKRLKIQWVSIYFLSIAAYGVLVSIITSYFTDIAYNFFILEFRFYLYIPLFYQIIKSSNFEIKRVDKYLTVLILFYMFVYLFLLDYGSFVFDVFNTERPKNAFDFLGRISGPPTVFLSMLYFISINIKSSIRNTVLYLILISIVYIKTGERTVLLVNLLPLFCLIYKKRSVWMLAALPFAASFVPLYVNKIQLKRFYDILDPMNDPAIRYRVENFRILLFEKMPEHPHTFFTGFGIGSDYDAHVFTGFNHSYFLDNTFLMLLYKFGFLVGLFFIVIVYSRIAHLKLTQQLYLLVFITIPALPMYHLVIQPVYLISYFLAIKFLTERNERALS